jgi:hypothetical protein
VNIQILIIKERFSAKPLFNFSPPNDALYFREQAAVLCHLPQRELSYECRYDEGMEGDAW